MRRLTGDLGAASRLWVASVDGRPAAAILVHQHPSGSPEPSREDLALTERLRAVGDLLGIRILDHVILGHDGAFRSLADDGRLGGGR